MDLNHATRLALGQSSEVDALLSDLQSNILGPHRRNFSTHWLLSFPQGAPQVQAFVAVLLAQGWIPSAAAGLRSNRPEEYSSLMFSSAGLDLLPAGFQSAAVPHDASFLAGAERREVAIDGDTADWGDPYRGRQIHAHFAVASCTQGARLPEVEALLAASGIAVVVRENAFVLRREKDQKAIEHFGFRDGISNPVFLAADMPGGQAQHWTPEFPVGRVLRAFGPASQPLYGSFCVLRKMEQDVAAFRRFEQDWAARHLTDGGSLMIGRTREGQSLAASQPGNDFNYRGDPEGARCPFHAHVRKANPRTTIQGDISRNSVFARRGMSYDDRTAEQKLAESWDRGVGLLFMAYMASVEGQFEHVMQDWVNNPQFPAVSHRDPLIGRPQPPAIAGVALSRFVRTKGGEYFFVPPLSWLSALVAAR